MTDLLAKRDICHLYGVRPKTADRWTSRESFPTNCEDGRYDRQAVEEWVTTHCVRSTTFNRWRYVGPHDGGGESQ